MARLLAALERGPDNVARLRRALRSVYDDEGIDEIRSSDLAGPYPVIRYGPPSSDSVIDIIGRPGEAYTFDDIESDTVEIDGVAVVVATPRMRYQMKRDTVRISCWSGSLPRHEMGRLSGARPLPWLR